MTHLRFEIEDFPEFRLAGGGQGVQPFGILIIVDNAAGNGTGVRPDDKNVPAVLKMLVRPELVGAEDADIVKRRVDAAAGGEAVVAFAGDQKVRDVGRKQ